MATFFRELTLPKAFLLGLVLSLCYLSILQNGPFLPDLILQKDDPFTFLSYFLKPKPDHLDKIVIVTVDDESMVRINRRWPWPRSSFGPVLEKISSESPRAILYDTTFTGASDDPQEDRTLAEAIRKTGKVILPSSFSNRGRYLPPLEPFGSAAAGHGLIGKPRDPDFVIRRMKGAFLSVDGQLRDYSFEVVAWATALGMPKGDLQFGGDKIRLGKTEIPLEQDGLLYLNYQSPWLNFETIPIWKLMQGEPSKGRFRDKFVIIGATSEMFHDIHQTPFGPMAGVGIIANVLLMFLNHHYLVSIPGWVNTALLFLAAALVVLFSYRSTLLKGFVFLFYFSAAIVVGSFFLRRAGILWDFLSPVLLSTLIFISINLAKYVTTLIENTALKEQAITDGLTGLYSYRYLELRLQNELARITRYKHSLSFLIFDLDHFKRVNDTYGHETGNVVLKGLSGIIRNRTRKSDTAARYGGEEFCVILPNTELEGARIYAEEIRKTLEQEPFPLSSGKTFNVTMSIGVTNAPGFGAQTVKQLIEQADKALYQAKEGGRNRVVLYSPALSEEVKT